MLRELNIVEPGYRAVVEILRGAPVTEVGEPLAGQPGGLERR